MSVIKKKSIFLSLTAIFAVALFVYSGVASSVSAAYAPLNGDVIKIDSVDRPAVYYIQNGKRYLFVNRVTYTTWASSVGDVSDKFTTLRKISQADFDKIPVGGNLTIKPGSKLIKFDDSNIVYAVGLGAKLYKLSDEAAKTALYGNIAPVIIQSSFRANYYDNGNAVATLASNSQKPEGVSGLVDPVNGTYVAAIPNGFKAYVNNELGFSLNIPINTYNNSNKLEPVEVIEAGNVIYITYKSNYYYKEMASRIANQISMELNDVKKTDGIPWGVMVRDVNNEQELDELIKERYGVGCSFGSKTLSGQPEIYDVKVKGDGLDLDKTKCPINFILHIKYSPFFKKAAIWDVGQAYNFLVKDVEDADSLMADSFSFIK